VPRVGDDTLEASGTGDASATAGDGGRAPRVGLRLGAGTEDGDGSHAEESQLHFGCRCLMPFACVTKRDKPNAPTSMYTTLLPPVSILNLVHSIHSSTPYHTWCTQLYLGMY
jgi:hypothetical protein